ncbi:proteasome subunit beta type-1-like [Drosophila miranda]|uniref:proteasome subunit beta type-1-like n=1 Tax=Drosophila miranda TaxID=7229 RepID=UPI00143F75DD|nr:proteasome subunit beta type-1-like [Drosophila miranda]
MWKPGKPDLYENNGGTVLAISGKDFVVIGGDTRLSSGCAILSRTQTKMCPLSKQMVVAAAGCWCDAVSLTNLLKVKQQGYDSQHHKVMSVESMAQMLSVVQYQRRHLPYNVSPILGGIDQDGQGAVFSYDCIGHFYRESSRVEGTAVGLLQPVLDNQIGYTKKDLLDEASDEQPTLTKKRALAIAKDAFITAAQSDVFTGDSVIINIITKDSIKSKTATHKCSPAASRGSASTATGSTATSPARRITSSEAFNMCINN